MVISLILGKYSIVFEFLVVSVSIVNSDVGLTAGAHPVAFQTGAASDELYIF